MTTLDSIAEAAEEAFWAKVAELLPEAKSGDLDPLDVISLREHMRSSIERWAELNLGTCEHGYIRISCQQCIKT